MEAEVAENVLRIDGASDSVHYQIRGRDIEALYDPIIGLNLISTSFIAGNLPYIRLYPTNQCLRDPDGNILKSQGLAKTIPTIIDGVEAFLDFCL